MTDTLMIADLCLTSAMIGFTVAECKQFAKIRRTKKTSGISLTHYYLKSYAVVATAVAYGLLYLPISFTFACVESILVIGATIMVRQYRKVEK